MMRAALRLYESGDAGDDLRVPIVSALLELYGDRAETSLLVEMVAVLAPLEQPRPRERASAPVVQDLRARP